MRQTMICRFTDEVCPAHCAHRGPHTEIVDDDFGEHLPCILAKGCEYCGVPSYCVSDESDLLAALERVRDEAKSPQNRGTMTQLQTCRFLDGLLAEIEPALAAAQGGKAER